MNTELYSREELIEKIKKLSEPEIHSLKTFLAGMEAAQQNKEILKEEKMEQSIHTCSDDKGFIAFFMDEIDAELFMELKKNQKREHLVLEYK